MHIDTSVYPDVDTPPQSLDSVEERADYVHRVCSAWDYGIHPDEDTFALFSEWKDIFERFPIVTSPAYHAMRAWFQWEPVPVPTGLHPPTPRYVEYDRLEGRDEDPCEQCI
ncbi:MAG: hypothetical protein HY657_20390 [Acidobacteria bacterium]|nr:hypothetical protein [Acidobacteriota bacterium]